MKRETTVATNSSVAMNSKSTAYVLWLGCLLQINGLHRLYNGKVASGLLWMFTFGLFGVGQFIDLFFIPRMVDDHNIRLRAKYGLLPPGVSPNQPMIEQVIAQPLPAATQPEPNKLMIQLLQAAAARGGRISVTQAVLDTGVGFDEVEVALRSLLKTGYVELVNDPDTGVVLYEFVEL
jgi:hypothetical protein